MPALLRPEDWHRRFQQQAAWTSSLRRYLYGQASMDRAARVLEVGCGTGVLTAEMSQAARESGSPGAVYGLDIDQARLALARREDPATGYTAGNALALPFADGAFDIVLCHFFLLWVPDPAPALAEMARVTRAGGAVLALAEPDYGGRIDHPEPLAEVGRLQTQALAAQGANPFTGRRLSGLFHGAGLSPVQTGVLGGEWRGSPSEPELDAEWQVLENDLKAGQVESYSPERLGDERLGELRALDRAAWLAGERVLFVPTFYAIGWKTVGSGINRAQTAG